MVGFKTKSSTYIIDSINKTITGGYFGDAKVPYLHISAMIGNKAYIRLADGRTISTGIVQKYL